MISYYIDLDISHLSLIRDILRDSNFAEAKWSNLGLSLRLHPNELESIKTSHHSHHERLLACLTLWLQSQGPHLPLFLASALNNNDEHTAADNIHKICKENNFCFILYQFTILVGDKASRIMLSYSEKFSQVRLPDSLVEKLKTDGIFNGGVVNEIQSFDGYLGLAHGALRAVCITVVEDHNKLIILANALLKFSKTKSLAQELLDDCSK